MVLIVLCKSRPLLCVYHSDVVQLGEDVLVVDGINLKFKVLVRSEFKLGFWNKVFVLWVVFRDVEGVLVQR